MRFPYHIPKSKRREVGREWGKRSAIARAAIRMEIGVDAETLYRRALHDAKGQTIREGCTYTATSVRNWLLRRSISGRTNQVDLLVDGRLLRTCGRLAADSAIRWAVWPKRQPTNQHRNTVNEATNVMTSPIPHAHSVDAVNLKGWVLGVSSAQGRSAGDLI